MTKQTFKIPEGCKAVTVEQVGNQIITTFESQFKRGDVLISTMGHICVLDEIVHENQAIEIVGLIEGEITYNSKPNYFDRTKYLRLATPEEAQRLWDALAKEGKRWNPETMQVEEIKKELCMAKKYDMYFYINSLIGIESFTETGHSIDEKRYKFGNYFQTEEQAKRAADKLKSALDDFWKEELK